MIIRPHKSAFCAVGLWFLGVPAQAAAIRATEVEATAPLAASPSSMTGAPSVAPVPPQLTPPLGIGSSPDLEAPALSPHAAILEPAPETAASAEAPIDAIGSLHQLGEKLQHQPAGEQSSLLNSKWDKASAQASGLEPSANSSGGNHFKGLRRPPPQDWVVQGVPSAMPRVAEGEVLFWDPKQREVDPYLASPNDDAKMVQAKTHNELERVRQAWIDVRAAVQGKVSPAALGRADKLVAQAEIEIERSKLKAELLLERLALGAQADADLELRQAADVVAQELIPALKNRSSLLYLTNDIADITLEQLHSDLKRLEKSRVMAKIFDRFLRLLYGFDVEDPRLAEGERANAGSRRLSMSGYFPLILREIEAGKTGEQALKAVLVDLRKKEDFFKAQLYADPKNVLKQKNFTFVEELSASFEAVKEELHSYDFVYEQNDSPEAVQAKKASELVRHEGILARALESFKGPSEELQKVLAQFKAEMRLAVTQDGRPIDFAAADFFARNQSYVRGDALDFLMLYSRLVRGGEQEAAPTKPIVALAREIRDEADYQDLRLSLKKHGRLVGIVTMGNPGKQGAGRMPHWVIFAKADGIVPITWGNLGAQNLSLAELAERLQRSGGKPGTAIIDGRRGQALFNASPGERAAWIARGKTYEKLSGYYQSRSLKPAALGGITIRFLADEADPKAFRADGGLSALEKSGAYGAGLVRMEQLMGKLGVEWDRPGIAAEFKEILDQPFFRHGAPLTVRLFDFEKDKVPNFVRQDKANNVDKLLETHSNVRFYLDKNKPEFREFGKMQLKALFEAHLASRGRGNVRVLFSNVQTAREIESIEELVAEAAAEFAQEQPNSEGLTAELAKIPIGYMVEDVQTVKGIKPYMAAIARLRARRPAERFIAIGTNDFQRSLLRGDPKAIDKLSKLDPRLVKGIWTVAAAAAKQGMKLTVDGEWASSPKLLLSLLALRVFYGVEATPVVYSDRAPELYELVRSLTVEDLQRPISGGTHDDMKGLLERLQPKRHAPTLDQFDAAAAGLAQEIENRILRGLSR